MNERESAQARDLEARLRLNNDPIFIIKQRRNNVHNNQRFNDRPRTKILSQKELQTLEYMSRGLTMPMVADAMGISVNTVREHVKNMREKLAAKNIAHACCEAIRQGLIK